MWYWLARFESLLFYLPFLIYASVRHIPYSTKCCNCGRWLWCWEHCWRGLCDKCVREEAKSKPRRLYEDIYDKVVPSTHGSLCEHINKAAAKRVGFGKVLEVGCGRGYLLSRLQSEHRELYGTDIGLAAIKLAEANTVGASLCAADARSLPFKSDSFDWLTCIGVLEHVEGDEATFECFRVLKPGGKAIFAVPNDKGAGDERAAEHFHSFTFASLPKYLQQAGFEVLSARKMGLKVPLLTYAFQVLSLATNKSLPFAHPLDISLPEFLASHLLIECRKPPI